MNEELLNCTEKMLKVKDSVANVFVRKLTKRLNLVWISMEISAHIITRFLDDKVTQRPFGLNIKDFPERSAKQTQRVLNPDRWRDSEGRLTGVTNKQTPHGLSLYRLTGWLGPAAWPQHNRCLCSLLVKPRVEATFSRASDGNKGNILQWYIWNMSEENLMLTCAVQLSWS